MIMVFSVSSLITHKALNFTPRRNNVQNYCFVYFTLQTLCKETEMYRVLGWTADGISQSYGDWLPSGWQGIKYSSFLHIALASFVAGSVMQWVLRSFHGCWEAGASKWLLTSIEFRDLGTVDLSIHSTYVFTTLGLINYVQSQLYLLQELQIQSVLNFFLQIIHSKYSQISVNELNSFLKAVGKPKLFFDRN
jgi:hypothetical protein